jgi:4-hydroxybenzoate polyprenyltransferase
LCWQGVIVTYSFAGLHKRWWSKNLLAMTIGTMSLVASAYEIAAPATPVSRLWAAAVGLMVGITIAVQDFRDMDGDRIVGRRTLPMLLPEGTARGLTAAVQLLAPSILHFALRGRVNPAGLLASDALLLAFGAVIAFRVLARRGPSSDHRTYILWTYWFCASLLTAALL